MSDRANVYGDQAFRAATQFLRVDNAEISHEERLAQAKWLANLMDSNFSLPGTPLRFGWDSVLGLFPGVGDAITSAISLMIVHHAWQTKASPLTLARMLGNVGVDFVIGAIPIVGDLFDLAFKANRKNARLLERHLERLVEKERASRARLPHV
jgi:Domain of unknown function (DUF4112)